MRGGKNTAFTFINVHTRNSVTQRMKSFTELKSPLNSSFAVLGGDWNCTIQLDIG